MASSSVAWRSSSKATGSCAFIWRRRCSRGAADGKPVKRAYGPGTLRLFRLLARLRRLRGTRFDPFGYTAERRQRELVREYHETLTAILPKLNRGNLDRAVALASVPEEIRGYGHVKEAAMARAAQRREALLKDFTATVVKLDGTRAA